jgi:hypothetical protein
MPEKNEIDPRSLPHKRDSSFASVYCNSAGFSMTFYDLTMVFGQILTTGPEGPHIQDRAEVTMSLEHAKALLEALAKPLQDYEAKYGPIRPKPSRKLEDDATEDQSPQ